MSFKKHTVFHDNLSTLLPCAIIEKVTGLKQADGMGYGGRAQCCRKSGAVVCQSDGQALRYNQKESLLNPFFEVKLM